MRCRGRRNIVALGLSVLPAERSERPPLRFQPLLSVGPAVYLYRLQPPLVVYSQRRLLVGKQILRFTGG